MVKRFIRLSLMVVVVLLVMAAPVYAVDTSEALYMADVVAINAGEAASNVIVACPINTEALIDGKYATADLLNTALQTASGTDIPYMPGMDEDPWCFFVEEIEGSEQKNCILYAGGPAMQTALSYFPDDGGMTTDDNDASLELGDDFVIDQRGWVDTTAGADKNLVYKGNAFQTYISGADNVTSAVASTVSISPYSSTSDGYITNSNAIYNTAWIAATGAVLDTGATSQIGQIFAAGTYYIRRHFFFFDTSAIPDDALIASATLKLYGQADFSTTDFLITIQNGQPTYPHDPLVVGDYDKTNYSGDGGSLTTAGFSTVAYNDIPLNATGLTWISVTGTTKLCVRSSRDISGTMPGGNEYVVVYNTEQAATDKDPQLVVNYYTLTAPAVTVTATGISSGVRRVVTSYDGADLLIQVYNEDDELIDDDTAAWVGTVPNSANGWSFVTNDSMLYMEYHKIYVDDVLVQHIVYERDTTFDDLTEYNNDATPTFMTTSSDPDVTGLLQNFKPISETKSTATPTEEEPEIFEEAPETPLEFIGAEESHIENLLGAAAINSLLDKGGIPQDFFWIIVVFGLAVLAILAGYHFIRSSLLWPAVVGGVVIAFFSLVCWGNPIPLWTVFIYGIRATGWLVAERTFGW